MISKKLETVEGRLQDLFEFVYRRQKIWYDRFVRKKPFPWTDDLVLRNLKFCNVYRELDKGTIYILDEVIDKLGDNPNTIFNTIAYRIFNKYNFFEDIGGLLDYRNFGDEQTNVIEKNLDNILENGGTVFNDAYMICGIPINRKYRPGDKHVQILEMLKLLAPNIDKLYKNIKRAVRPKDILKELKGVYYIGNFLAYEIWCDLSYINDPRMFKWTDDDFVNMGPGAKWGVRLIWGGEKKDYKDKDYIEKCKWLRDIQVEYWEKIPFIEVAYDNAYSNQPFLSLRNVEHSLCEYRKYYNQKYLRKGKRRKFSEPVEG